MKYTVYLKEPYTVGAGVHQVVYRELSCETDHPERGDERGKPVYYQFFINKQTHIIPVENVKAFVISE